MGIAPCALPLMTGNTGSCCLSAVHLFPCKYRDFYINLIKELYKQSCSSMGLEVERATTSGHQLSFTTVLGLAQLQARSVLSPLTARPHCSAGPAGAARGRGWHGAAR